MADSVDWKQIYSARQHATEEGERIALAYEFYTPPVDPLRIIHAERRLIHAVGDDFGNAFDGRIKYIGPRFLICYNTRYNAWPHIGCHHSKVLFTICHELGHYFIEEHRKILVSTCTAHGSQTEFVSDLLIDKIKQIRRSFQVSLIGMLVRWTQLSDFPCATIAINDGVIQFGWASEEFRRIGAYRIRRGEEVEGREMQRFARQDPTFSKYREGSGTGAVINWIDYDQKRLDTMEHYFAIPYTKTIWVFLFVDENDFPESDFY